MTWTDISVFLLLTFLTANGAYQGFLRSLFGPISFVLGTATAYAVFFTTRNIIAAAFAVILAPVFFTWAFNVIIRIWNGDVTPKFTFLSRFAGAAMNLVWNGTFIGLTMLFLAILPLKDSRLNAVRLDMKASLTYHLLEQATGGNKKPPAPPVDCPSGACSMNKADLDALATDKELVDIQNDERVKNLVNDPALREAIEKKDFPKLFANPTIISLLQDPQFITKILKVYPKIRARMKEPVPAGP